MMSNFMYNHLTQGERTFKTKQEVTPMNLIKSLLHSYFSYIKNIQSVLLHKSYNRNVSTPSLPLIPLSAIFHVAVYSQST